MVTEGNRAAIILLHALGTVIQTIDRLETRERDTAVSAWLGQCKSRLRARAKQLDGVIRTEYPGVNQRVALELINPGFQCRKLRSQIPTPRRAAKSVQPKDSSRVFEFDHHRPGRNQSGEERSEAARRRFLDLSRKLGGEKLTIGGQTRPAHEWAHWVLTFIRDTDSHLGHANQSEFWETALRDLEDLIDLHNAGDGQVGRRGPKGHQKSAVAADGIWRTIEGDQRIFITGAGEVRAGGPNGPVISAGPKQTAGTNNRTTEKQKPTESAPAAVPTTKPKPEIPSFTGKSEITFEQRGYYTQRKATTALRQLLGPRYKEMILRIAGAPDGSRAVYSLDTERHQHVVSVKFENAELGVYAKRRIYLFDRQVYNEYLSIDQSKQGAGTGTAILLAQVRNASRLRFKNIKCFAAGGGMNGYYTWPRLGYDGPIPDHAKTRLSKDFKGAASYSRISDLMKKPDLRAWWKANGTSFDADFDLTPNSQSRKVLSNYARAKQRTATKS